MSRRTAFALLTLSTLSFATSATTLVVVLVGGRRVQVEMEQVKTKTQITVNKLKSVLADFEL